MTIVVAAAALRLAHVAALLVLFGTLVFRHAVGSCPRWLVRLAWAVALAGGAGWLTAQAVLFAGPELSGLGAAMTQTRFGRVLLLRLLLLAPLPWLSAGRGACALAIPLAGAALAVQPWLGHAGAAGAALPALASALHMLGAGAWVGSLPALALALRRADPPGAARLARRFGWLGGAGAVLLVAGAAGQAFVLAGDPPAWIGTPYGQALLGKLALLLALLGIAARNRFRLTPRLADPAARLALRGMVAADIVLGLAAVALAVLLAGWIPGAHAQPDWPFAWRPSPAALAAPELRAEFGQALLGLGAALAAAAVALAGFHRRFAAAVLALCGLAWVWPTVPLLIVPAWPTSYWRAPAATPEARARGATLFGARCAGCHGPDGRGDGPEARALPVPPADLTEAHLWAHTDGELYWWIGHGMPAPRGGLAMPGQPDLAEDDIWALLAHVQAANPYAALNRRAVHSH